MMYIRHLILFTCASLIIISCSKENYTIDYQDGYPNALADNWVAFEFRGGSLEGAVSTEPYDLVTSLDPNRPNSLIIDRLYASDVRIRTTYTDTSFSVVMGEMLESVSTNTFNIEYVTVTGYITANPVLTNTLYSLAQAYFEDMSFDRSDIEDLLFLRAGFYDQYKAPIDTVLILGYRKTGFEEVSF